MRNAMAQHTHEASAGLVEIMASASSPFWLLVLALLFWAVASTLVVGALGVWVATMRALRERRRDMPPRPLA